MAENALTDFPPNLLALAQAWGAQVSYEDALGAKRCASVDATLAALSALGAPVQTMADVDAALAEREAEAARLEPCAVLWDGSGSLPASGSGRVALTGVDESGQQWASEAEVVDGRVSLELPHGVHVVNVGQSEQEVVVISAPQKSFSEGSRSWGLFAPLYAMHDQRSVYPDLGTLRRAGRVVRELGGSVIGTLPLLAGSFEPGNMDPSPYSPISRVMWNELYIELDAIAELRSDSATAALADAAPSPPSDFVDYRLWYDHRASVLQRLADSCAPERLETFLTRRPEVDVYARFRASRPIAAGESLPSEGDAPWDARRRFHTYVQMVAEEQMASLGATTDLYLDLPLGARGDGFDAFMNPSLFAFGAGAGAPPDPLFEGGQAWGFPPIRPEVSRRSGHAYLRKCLAHHMRHASVLRVDHVAWLHRLFWVPDGRPATDGLYVHNSHPEELFAILSLFSHRYRCRLIGEDLGTVPDAVRENMSRHGLLRTWVFQFAVRDEEPLWDAPPEASTITVSTHDTATFAGWLNGVDIPDRVDLGLYTAQEAAAEAEGRDKLRAALKRVFQVPEAGPLDVLEIVLDGLAGGEGELLLISIEDLFGEERPQNTPGTSFERPNWRGRMAHPLEALRAGIPQRILQKVAHRRPASGAPPSGENLPELMAIMRRLLSPEGCPWDREQSLETLRAYVVEEAFEVVDAINSGRPELLREELGDLLFQIVFQSELARQQGWFAMDDVVQAIGDKMVRRHPWVFGDQKVEGGDAALSRWEAMKAKEKKERGALDGVPVALPALLRALRVGEKAGAVGYDWPDAASVRPKIDEELAELEEALDAGDQQAAEDELGDLLFAVVSFARKNALDPEVALRRCLDRFSDRFRHAEKAAKARGQSLRELDAEELDRLWEDAKRAKR